PEDDRVAPYHRQFPRRIARGAFQAELVDLEHDRALPIDQHHVRPQGLRRLVEAEALDRRIRWDQVHGLWGAGGRLRGHASSWQDGPRRSTSRSGRCRLSSLAARIMLPRTDWPMRR